MALHYFISDYMTGTPVEIYRSSMAGQAFSDGTLERARQNGAWSAEEHEVRPVINQWLKGEFDPEVDEISEQEAETYLEKWRAGNWLGRP